jgi:hypothetical protein
MHQQRAKVSIHRVAFYKELLLPVFNQFPEYDMKILFGDFNAKGEKIFSN